MSLSRPVLIKVRTLSICFIIVELTSTDSTDPRDEEVRGETRRGGSEQMSVKVMGEKLADTRSKVSLASSDRLRLDACALFGGAAATAAAAVVAAPLSLPRFIPYLSLSSRNEAAKVRCELTVLIDPIPPLSARGH